MSETGVVIIVVVVVMSVSKPNANMLWGGRFTGGMDPIMVSYNESIHFDKAIYAQDIRGSIAYARANSQIGILTPSEFAAIERGFGQVLEEWQTNTFKIVPGVDEDIHTANERRLGEIIGTQIAGKLHTGRSRNDQVATGMRLWLRDQLRTIDSHLVALLRVIVSRAESEIDHLMPGYTHLQRAQPIRWSHWLLCHGHFFHTDLVRLREVIARVNRSPLGAGALVGNPFGVDRAAMAAELGFDSVIPNSLAAVSDRDFVLETLQWSSSLMTHISRWAEDLIVYSTAEFNFVRLADAYSTGSSLMPQKKNPDSLELLRGKSGSVFGHLAGLSVTLKGLPSTYNKDMQESWRAMLDGVRTTADSVQIATGVLSTLTLHPDRMRAALTPDMLATDLADHLVRRGVPFRETHHVAGRVVALAERLHLPMDHLTLDQLRSVDPRFADDVREDCFDFTASVERRTGTGGTSRASVLEQIRLLSDAIQ